MAPTVQGFYNTGNYSSTFSTSGSNHNLIANGNFQWDGGTFNANASTITIKGHADLSGGAFTAGSSTVEFTGGGNVVKIFTPGSSDYNDIIVNKNEGSSAGLAISGTLEVQGSLTHTDGVINTGTVNLYGNYIIGANASGGNATVTFVNNVEQNRQNFTLRFNSTELISSSARPTVLTLEELDEKCPVTSAYTRRDDVTQAEDYQKIKDREQTECNVCLEQCTDAQLNRILPCQHLFHCACVDQWLGQRRSCPVCRDEI